MGERRGHRPAVCSRDQGLVLVLMMMVLLLPLKKKETVKEEIVGDC